MRSRAGQFAALTVCGLVGCGVGCGSPEPTDSDLNAAGSTSIGGASFGGGSATGRPIRAVQVGGPLGAFLPEKLFDTPLDYEAFAKLDGMIGHGGVVAFDDTVDMAHMARYAMEFCAIESCGKCTPCRIGSTRGTEVIDRIVAGEARDKNLDLLEELCQTMLHGSLCALGGMTPFPVLSALRHFPEDFRKPAAQRAAA